MGKSTETALHNVVTCLESATENKDIALGASLDIEAFNTTSCDIIKQAAENLAFSPQHKDGSVLCWKAVV
jgi:hypothetical protein